MEQRPLVPQDRAAQDVQNRQLRSQAFSRAAFALCVQANSPDGPTSEEIVKRWEIQQPRIARLILLRFKFDCVQRCHSPIWETGPLRLTTIFAG
jgi:hypothetical protein